MQGKLFRSQLASVFTQDLCLKCFKVEFLCKIFEHDP